MKKTTKTNERQLSVRKPKLLVIQGDGNPKPPEPTPDKGEEIWVVKGKTVHFEGQFEAIAFCKHLNDLADAYGVRPLPFYVQEKNER